VGRGIALPSHDLGTRRGCAVSITPWPLYPWKRPDTHCTGGWVGPRAGLDVYEKYRWEVVNKFPCWQKSPMSCAQCVTVNTVTELAQWKGTFQDPASWFSMFKRKSYSHWGVSTIVMTLMFCWPCIVVYQYSEISVMNFLFNLLRIKGLYMFQALLARPLEVLHSGTWCIVCVLCKLAAPGLKVHFSLGAANWHNTHTIYCISRPIRRTLIFSLEILEKWMYFNFSNLLGKNRIVTYEN
jgi:hypothetical protein